jgi:hypothetical protein
VSTENRIGRGWVGFTTVALWAIFLQSVTAGRIFSGDEWARTTHRTAAGLMFLVVVVFAAQANMLARRLAVGAPR